MDEDEAMVELTPAEFLAAMASDMVEDMRLTVRKERTAKGRIEKTLAFLRYMEDLRANTRRIRGVELQTGDIVVQRDGTGRLKSRCKLVERIPIFDGWNSSGRGCDGVHFKTRYLGTKGDGTPGPTACFDKFAWNEVIRNDNS